MSAAMSLADLGVVPQAVIDRLRRSRVLSTSDVLRCPIARLARVLQAVATQDEVLQWQAICALLEVSGMKLDWAVALARRTGTSARDLELHAVSRLLQDLTEAHQHGEVAAVPDTDTIAKLQVDATRIRCGGVVNLTVHGGGKRPVSGAIVHCAGMQAETDANGRARFLRLPLGQPLPFVVEKSRHATRTVSLQAHPVQVVSGERIVLKKGRPAKKAVHRARSELDGHVVTVPPGTRIRVVEQPGHALRAGDVLYLAARLQNGELKLSSRYKQVEGGAVIVPCWRMPAGTLPQDAPVRGSYRVTPQGLKPVVVTASTMARWRLARQIRAELRLKATSPKGRWKQAVRRLNRETRSLHKY